MPIDGGDTAWMLVATGFVLLCVHTRAALLQLADRPRSRRCSNDIPGWLPRCAQDDPRPGVLRGRAAPQQEQHLHPHAVLVRPLHPLHAVVRLSLAGHRAIRADGAFRCGRYIIGYTLALGPDAGGIIGDLSHTFFIDVEGENIGNGTSATHSETGSIPTTVFASFQMMFSVITPLLITGAFSERVGFGAFCGFIVLWSIIIYYPVCK